MQHQGLNLEAVHEQRARAEALRARAHAVVAQAGLLVVAATVKRSACVATLTRRAVRSHAMRTARTMRPDVAALLEAPPAPRRRRRRAPVASRVTRPDCAMAAATEERQIRRELLMSVSAKPRVWAGLAVVAEREVMGPKGQWTVRELDTTTLAGARGPRCLYLETALFVRRVWNYPADWQSLSADELLGVGRTCA